MWCILKNTYFCTIYSALEFGSSIKSSVRNGWIVFMSDCFLFSHMVYAYMCKSVGDTQRCRIFTCSYSNDWTCSNGSNHLKTKCYLFSSLAENEHGCIHRYAGYIYILTTRQTSLKCKGSTLTNSHKTRMYQKRYIVMVFFLRL